MIYLKDLSFTYAACDAPALCGVDLIIPEGCFAGITGTVGSGKTTLARAVCGIIPHGCAGTLSGSVVVGSLDTAKASLTELSRLVGSVAQDFDAQIICPIVEDEVRFGLEGFGIPEEEASRRIDGALDALGISELRDRSIGSLSSGQRQKVAVASLMALQPPVLLLDEPTSQLDLASARSILSALKQDAVERGATVVVVEQKVELLAELADKLIVMDGGRIRCEGKPGEVREQAGELFGVDAPQSAQDGS